MISFISALLNILEQLFGQSFVCVMQMEANKAL